MLNLVEDYSHQLKRDRSALELLLTFQSREMGRLFATGDLTDVSEIGRLYAMLRRFGPQLISRQQTFINSGQEIDWPPLQKGIPNKRIPPPKWYDDAQQMQHNIRKECSL